MLKFDGVAKSKFCKVLSNMYIHDGNVIYMYMFGKLCHVTGQE